MYYVISILLGLMPEVLYFTLFLIHTKKLENKRIKLFCLIAISYFLCILVQSFQILFYMLLIALIYIILKLLYKKKIQIIDVFIISLSYFWVILLSFIMIFFLDDNYSNYWMLYVINRILLFVPFIFKSKFNNIYKKYCSLWNRNDRQKRPIKSITLRNISLILLNSFVFFINITIINMINYMK